MTTQLITGIDIDPQQYSSVEAFKHAVYDAGGPGTWLDDAKLELIWRLCHNEPIPDSLQPLLADNSVTENTQ